MLSKDAEKILKILKEQDDKYQKKEKDTSKLSYDEIKEDFPSSSCIRITMILKYLLEERYVYNHIEGREHEITIKDIENNNLKLVIGEKGFSYLQYKKYRLLAQIIPLTVSVISLLLAIFNLIYS